MGALLSGMNKKGVEALHSGMNKEEVIAALGEPSCSDNTHDGLPPKSTGLAYKKGANTYLVVELDERGIIYGRTVVAFEGHESASEACSGAAFGPLKVDVSRTKTFSFFIGGPGSGLENFDVKEHHPY